MSRIAFVTWNGGGNLTPALAIVRELHRSGHRAAFLGLEAQRPPWRGIGADEIKSRFGPYFSLAGQQRRGARLVVYHLVRC